jgi:hypothetical protein
MVDCRTRLSVAHFLAYRSRTLETDYESGLAIRLLALTMVRAQNEDSEKLDIVEDPNSPGDSIKLWMWLPGLTAVLILTCIVMRVQYVMPIMETLLALFLASLLTTD